MCAQAESEALELFLVVAKESSKRRSGRGGSQGGAGRLACQSPRETPAWLCVHKAGLCQPCMLSGGPLWGASSLFLHILACLAYFNVYICHIIAVGILKASMSENGGVWFTLGVQPVTNKKHLKCDETPSGTCYKRYGRFQCFHSVSMDTSES